MSIKMIHGASSSSSRRNFDVFLSFRGKDTRNNFIAHLFTALDRDGIHTFLDDEELERGEDISSELMDAIKGSRIAIVVFSENYADSSWCLDELVQILKCKNSGQTVLPVFYKVDPSDVRHQKNTFAEAIVKHEKRFKEEKVKSWKNALTEAANLSGWDHIYVANGNESELIKTIVVEVSRIVDQTHLCVAEYPIGLDSHIERITCLLNDGLDVVRFIGIHGLGGIGKTTIAKATFNAMFQNFDGSSFLADVREASSQHNGLANLQKQLLSDVFKKKHEDISNEDRGIILVKKRLCRKRVLIVLDDVDAKKQLDKLVGKHDWFGMGSRIIITTRNEHLLNIPEVNKKYKVETMNENESLQLFSLHAFRQKHPLEGYFQLSRNIVQYARGLPLALVILGSLLLDKRSQVEWESELEKLRKIPNNEIFEILEISYHALDDSNQKIFLDISCFFIGDNKDGAIEILDACGLYPKAGIRLLIERSLLTIDEFGKFCMHDLIRDMGREIVRRRSPDKPGERSRLWKHDETLDVLRNHTGTNAVDRLMFNMFMSTRAYRFQLSMDAFFKMPDLRVLRIYCSEGANYGVIEWVHCPEDEKILFKNLIYFYWLGFPFKYIPNNFHLGNLVILNMFGSENLEQLWKGTKHLPKLKVIDLSLCSSLTYTPDFLGIPNLEKLILRRCSSLVEVHESIGYLSNLVELDFSDCASISSLPSSISKLASLEKLDISKCGQLENLPEGIGNLTRLSVLNASECKLLERLPNLSNLKHLRILDISRCQKLNVIEGFYGLESAETINLYCCNNLTSFGEQRIFQHLPKLKVLHPSMCSNLTCTPDFSGIPNLEKLSLYSCSSLVEVHESIGHLSNLIELDLSCCREISSLPSSISKLASLEKLDISYCGRLKNLPDGIGNLTRLSVLKARNCKLLERLPNLSNLKRLRILDLSECQKLNVIEGIEGLESADTIRLDGCNNLTSFTEEKIFQVIFEDFRNGNICEIHLSYPTKIFERFDIPSEKVPASYCLVTQHPNMEIQGVIICVVFEVFQTFSNPTPVVVVHNESKNVTWDHCSGDFPIVLWEALTYVIWMIKIPQCVWKSIAECGDIIKISLQNDEPRRSRIRIGANFCTLQGTVIHARVCDMI